MWIGVLVLHHAADAAHRGADPLVQREGQTLHRGGRHQGALGAGVQHEGRADAVDRQRHQQVAAGQGERYRSTFMHVAGCGGLCVRSQQQRRE